MDVDKDHVHLLLKYTPSQSVVNIAKLFKQISTHYIWDSKENSEDLRKRFWKRKVFWSDGYFASSIGQVSEEGIRKYIQDQG